MSAKREPICTWDAERGWLTPEHVRDCKTFDCAGCKPCPKTHCAMRGRCANHVDVAVGLRTCPSCIGSTRAKLGRIELLYALADVVVEARGLDLGALLDEAAEGGVESEALNLVGPAAAPEQWSEKRRRLAVVFEARGWCDYPRPEAMADDDPHHPYSVLARWDQALREQYGPQTDLFVTVVSAINYLRSLLAGPFPHEDEFEDFASEIAACCAHLETVIHDSRSPEVGRPCPRCAEVHGKGPKLQKRYAAHPGLPPGERCAVAGCRICAGRDDTWHCPDVAEHWWAEEDYRLRVASDYLEHAADLPAQELADRLGVALSTVRKWTARTWDDDAGEWTEPRLVSHRRGPDGRKVYPVVIALGLAERRGA